MSPGVGSYPWISAPGFVIEVTSMSSPATFCAISASTVKVVSTCGRSAAADCVSGAGAEEQPARQSAPTADIAATSIPREYFGIPKL